MIYLDNAATTYKKPSSVYKQTMKFYKKYNANAGRGQHFLSKKAGELIQDTEKRLLEFLGCDYSSKVIFTPSATISLNMVLQGLDFSKIKNVYISPFEHNAVLRVLYLLQEKYSFNIIQLDVRKKTFKFDLERINKAFTKNEPDLVIISQISNVFGATVPVKRIFELSKKYGSINVVDMAQSAGLINQQLKDIDFDFAIFAGHKTLYAFQGIAGIIHKDNIKLKQIIVGGTGIKSADKKMPDNTMPGTSNILAIASLYYSLEYLEKMGKDRIENTEKERTKELIEILSEFKEINVISNPTNCLSVVSCTFKNYAVDDIAALLSKNGVCVRAGLHCSPLAHKFAGTEKNGTLRFSVSLFTTSKDLKNLKKVLRKIF